MPERTFGAIAYNCDHNTTLVNRVMPHGRSAYRSAPAERHWAVARDITAS